MTQDSSPTIKNQIDNLRENNFFVAQLHESITLPFVAAFITDFKKTLTGVPAATCPLERPICLKNSNDYGRKGGSCAPSGQFLQIEQLAAPVPLQPSSRTSPGPFCPGRAASDAEWVPL
ncbi:hypothetical protein Zmor_010015 [Zophobas morio]|uniref:Uncharacterized protein n=1 Tax=Zophobas morio TaxID=2755281 RepID=A0AA38ING0_9CUCU|nr:hypothetical protein Zmor_010015 [Zophobas morio]